MCACMYPRKVPVYFCRWRSLLCTGNLLERATRTHLARCLLANPALQLRTLIGVDLRDCVRPLHYPPEMKSWKQYRLLTFFREHPNKDAMVRVRVERSDTLAFLSLGGSLSLSRSRSRSRSRSLSLSLSLPRHVASFRRLFGVVVVVLLS